MVMLQNISQQVRLRVKIQQHPPTIHVYTEETRANPTYRCTRPTSISVLNKLKHQPFTCILVYGCWYGGAL